MKGLLLKKFKKMILRMLKRRRRRKRKKLKKSVKCALHRVSAVLERTDTIWLCFITGSCDWSLVIHLIYSILILIGNL